MKKLITLAATCLSLGALVACGKGGEAKESKTEWTAEEKALISGKDGVLNFELPFYQAKLKVEASEEDGILYVTSERKATDKDVEAYIALLEEADYEEFDTQYGEDVGTDVLDFVEYKDDEFFVCFKNVPYQGSESVTNDVVAVGLTDDDTLVIAATVFYNYFDLNGGYQPGILGYTSHMEGWMANFGYTVGSVPWPSAEAFPEATQVDVLELSLLYPFTMGNVYSEEFCIGYDMFVIGASEAEYNDFVETVNAAVELSSSQGVLVGFIESEEGTTVVGVGSYIAEHEAFEFFCEVSPVEEAE